MPKSSDRSKRASRSEGSPASTVVTATGSNAEADRPRGTAVTIRRARATDAASLPGIERSAACAFRAIPELAWIADDDVTPADAHRATIARGTVWVAETDRGRPIGVLSAEEIGRELHIWLVAVAHEFQGRGIGRGLIRAAAAHAETRGLAAITLTTFRDVAWNEPFYACLGFERLDGHAIGDRLATLIDREAEHGLPRDRRCAMRRPVRAAAGHPLEPEGR